MSRAVSRAIARSIALTVVAASVLVPTPVLATVDAARPIRAAGGDGAVGHVIHALTTNGAICATGQSDRLSCWGGSEEAPPPHGRFVSLAGAEYDNWCGIRPSGHAVCWSRSDGGGPQPTGKFTSLALDSYRRCGLRANGEVSCWTDDNGVPEGPLLKLSMSDGGACGLQPAGKIVCESIYTPNRLGHAPAGTYVDVEVGSEFACGIRTDATLVCWGHASFPNAVPPAGTFTQVSVGAAGACALATDETVKCWGNYVGAPPADQFETVQVGSAACGKRSDSRIVCWGFDGSELRPGILDSDLWAHLGYEFEWLPYTDLLTPPLRRWRITSGTLPAGLTFDPSTGGISGTPTEYGNFDLTFAANHRLFPGLIDGHLHISVS